MKGKEYRKYTMVDYKNVLLLRRRGYSFNEIAKKIGISPTTAQFWIKTARKPRFIYGKRIEKKLDIQSKKLSPELAYIYGVLVGDGSISKEKGTYRIILNVTDKDFADKFSKILKKWSKMKPSIKERDIFYNHRTKYGNLIKGHSHLYVVRLDSKQVGEFILNRLKCKTFEWEVPQDVLESKNKKIICNFLKGFFDSEGYVVFSGNSRRIEAEVSCLKGLSGIQKLLKRIDTESKILQGEKQKIQHSYILRVIKRRDLEKFAKQINFSILRKKSRFEKLLKSYKRGFYVYSKPEVEKIIKTSLENGSKTAKEISKDVDRALRTTYYHLQRLNKENKIDVIRRWKRNEYKSNIWFIKK